MSAMEDDFDDYDDQSEVCPHCVGNRLVSCHCGGDLCFCDNYGERDCPVCYGEGAVSHERSAQYRKAEGEAMAAIRAAWNTTPEDGGA